MENQLQNYEDQNFNIHTVNSSLILAPLMFMYLILLFVMDKMTKNMRLFILM